MSAINARIRTETTDVPDFRGLPITEYKRDLKSNNIKNLLGGSG